MSVQLLVSAQVLISWLMSLSLVSSSVLTVQSVLGILSPSVCPSATHSVSVSLKINKLKKKNIWGAWVVQSVKCLTLAQVMISWFEGLSPVSGSVLTACSLQPAACLRFCVSLSLPLPHSQSACLTVSLSLSQK